MGWPASARAVQLLTRGAALLPDGPSETRRSTRSATLVAEAVDARGGAPVRARLKTPEVYTFTAAAAVAVAERVLAGDLGDRISDAGAGLRGGLRADAARRGAGGFVKRLVAPSASAARHSAAIIDALVCPIRVDRARLAACLPPVDGLSLGPARGRSGRSHPVLIEVWRVRDGRVEAAGLDVHGWSQAGRWGGWLGGGGASGGAVGATFGGVVGAAGGGVMGLPFGPAGLFSARWPGRGGALDGCGIRRGGGRRVRRGAVRSASRRIERDRLSLAWSYAEMLVTTPWCSRPPRAKRCPSRSCWRCTPTAVSPAGVKLRWGSRSASARHGCRSTAADLEVQTSGRRNVAAGRRYAPPSRQPLPDRCGRGEGVRATAAMPLVGQRSGRAVLSGLERDFDDGAVRLWPASGRLEVADGFVPGVPAG